MDSNHLLKQNPYWCVMPFVHLHVNEQDMIKPCCYGNPIKKFPIDFDYIADRDLQKIRESMLAAKPVAVCANCYRVETNGGESFRQRDSVQWLDKLKIQSLSELQPSAVYYDIRNDNTCNLSCRMCHPGASSQLVKEYQRIGWTVIDTSRAVKLNEIVDYNTVQKVMVAGGEPTIMPEFQTFLSKALANGRDDIDLMVITNATNVNAKVFDLLAKFKQVQFTVSIDGYDQINRYIRWPSDWQSLNQNIAKLKSITEHVSFSVCASIWNISNLSLLVKFLEREYQFPVIMINQAMNPNHEAEISPFLFPYKDVALADLEQCKNTLSYQNDVFFRNRIDYLINGINQTPIDHEKLAKFFVYNDQLDSSRGIQLQDYIPILAQARHPTAL